jgi:hypothetical protein
MVIPNLYSSFIQFKLHTHIVTSMIEMLVPVRSEHVRALYFSLKASFILSMHQNVCQLVKFTVANKSDLKRLTIRKNVEE